MSKLSYKDKIKIYKLRKEGKQISYLSEKYKVRSDNIAYLIRLIDKHGLEITKKDFNKYYPPYQKEKIMHDEIEITLDTVMQSTHPIQIQKNSHLYAIYQKKQIEVISLHSYCVNPVGTQFVITAKAQDGVIEAIEYNQNGFFIVGVQYHPEFGKNDCLFEQLLTECQNRK